MAKITIGRYEYRANDSESVLDCLLRHGLSVPFSCRIGACQSCLMRSIKGRPPAASQHGLKETLKLENYFLACSCVPDKDMDVMFPAEESHPIATRVIDITRLTATIARIRLERPASYTYRPGQYLNLHGPDGVGRSYSLASVPELSDYLELHIRRIATGTMSSWIHEALKPGTELSIGEAMGQCFYAPGRSRKASSPHRYGLGPSPIVRHHSGCAAPRP